MKRVFYLVCMASILFACEKNDSEVEKSVELKNQWSIAADVKTINAAALSLDEKSAQLYKASLNIYTGAKEENNRLQLNLDGSTLAFTLFYTESLEGDYQFTSDEKNASDKQFSAKYQLDHNLLLGTNDKAVAIKGGKLSISKNENDYTISFELNDANSKLVRGNFTGKLHESFNVKLKNQWRINNEVLDFNANVVYHQESPAEKVLNASINLYTGAKIENARLMLNTTGSSINLSVNFTEDIVGTYALVPVSEKNTEAGKFQAFYGKDYALNTPTQSNFKSISSGNLSITKSADEYSIQFELKDADGITVAGNYTAELTKSYAEYNNILSTKTWSPSSMYVNGVKIDSPVCKTDDVITFNADGTYSMEVNTSCDPNDPDEDETGTYRIENGALKMIPSGSSSGDQTPGLIIKSISKTKLILFLSGIDKNNKPVTYEYVME